MSDGIRHYRIGEFARKVGVSPDFLKYQGEFGVVNPRQSENSNYRYYPFAQAGRVFASLGYQSLGFTLREIEDILSKDSTETLIGKLKDKSAELEGEITRIKACLMGIDAIQQAERLETRAEPWFINDVPAFAFLPHSRQQDFVDDETVPQILRAWVEWLPLVASIQHIQIPCSGEVGDDEAEGGGEGGAGKVDFSWGFAVDGGFAIEHRLPLDAPVRMIELGRCLVYHQRIELEEAPSATQTTLGRILEKPLAVAKSCGLALSGTVYNKVLFITHEGHSRTLHSVLSLQLADT
jgi:DNA-binding transcriptional MerR regulator